MQIRELIHLGGARGGAWPSALIDTGAEMSVIPSGVASEIGALATGRHVSLTGVHRDTKTLALMQAEMWFPDLQAGGWFEFAVSDHARDIIVGMDILNPLGVSIDTETGHLSRKGETFGAFFKLALISGAVLFGSKIAGAMLDRQ